MNVVLSEKEIDDYINTIMIPGFMPLLDKKLKSAIWKKDGKLVIATTQFARNVGFTSYHEMQNLSVKQLLSYASLDVFVKFFPRLKAIASKITITSEKSVLALNVIKEMNAIKERVFKEQSPINAILVHPFLNTNETPILLKYMPIFHPNGQIIAVQSFLDDFNLFGVIDYLSGADKYVLDIPRKILDISALPIALTTRQHEVVFLLTIGLTQMQISELLHINRGTVSRLINDTICPKFGINNSNSKILIEKAKKMGINAYIPPSLCKPWLIILNDNVSNESDDNY